MTLFAWLKILSVIYWKCLTRDFSEWHTPSCHILGFRLWEATWVFSTLQTMCSRSFPSAVPGSLNIFGQTTTSPIFSLKDAWNLNSHRAAVAAEQHLPIRSSERKCWAWTAIMMEGTTHQQGRSSGMCFRYEKGGWGGIWWIWQVSACVGRGRPAVGSDLRLWQARTRTDDPYQRIRTSTWAGGPSSAAISVAVEL